MRRNLKLIQKLTHVIVSLALIFQSLFPALPLMASQIYAQDVTPVVSPTPTVTQISPEPTSVPTAVPTVEVTLAPTAEPSAAPTTEASPSPVAEVSPTVPVTEPTPTTVQTATGGEVTTLVVDNKSAQSIENLNLDPEVIEANPSIITDKADYAPTDAVVITGTGFIAGTIYNIYLTADSFSFNDSFTTDENGGFVYSYQLDGVYRPLYNVEIKDVSGSTVAVTSFTDSNPSADLDQYATIDGAWVNGNLGASKALYYEGDSIPYRMKFDSLSLGSHTVIIEWDTTKSGKHAIDYLTTYNRTIDTADPCAGVSGCDKTVFDTFAIPPDPQVTGAGVTPVPGDFTLFGGEITGVGAYLYLNGTGFTGDKSARIAVTFTAGVVNPVLTWGGHVATRSDWGQDGAAVNIPGSPYHMRLIDLDGKGGNQDRSLSTEAIIYPGSITIIKDATPNGSTSFPFTASPLPLINFSLVDDGTSANTRLFENITNFTTYSVAETVPPSWSLDSINCTVTSANGGSRTVNLPGVTINLKEGENVTCTFYDTFHQVAPTVVTTIHSGTDHSTSVTSVPVGSTVHDSVTVGGSFGYGTGNVTFNWYLNGSCTGAPEAVSSLLPLSDGTVDATGFPQGPLTYGSYSFKAHYDGDSNYLAGDSDCEPLTVTKVNTDVTTQVHNNDHEDITGNSIPLGSVVHDSATVGGQVGSIALTGTVTYHYYLNNECTGTPSDETVAVGEESSLTGILAAGGYSFLAEYSGDTNYNSSVGVCEPFNVNKAGINLATELHNQGEVVIGVGDSVALGTSMHDKATVSDGVESLPISGTVSFTFFENGTCTGVGTSAGTVNIIDGVAHPSNNMQFLTAGDYAFKAHYNGNANYDEVDSTCEYFTVSKADLSVTTQIHEDVSHDVVTSAPLGTTVHDRAVVSGINGAAAPANPVVFTFYNNLECEGTGVAAGSVALVSGVAHPSNPQGPLAAGSYSFKASIAGDDNYNGDNSDCEPLTIDKAPLTVATLVHNSAHTDKTNSNVPLGSVMHDIASVTGGVEGFALPAVSFTLTSNYVASCADGASVAVNGTEGDAVRSTDSTALSAGTYAYRAVVAGNDNYIGTTGICEPFTVDKAQLTVTTAVHNPEHTDVTNTHLSLGSIVHDTADVTGKVIGFDVPDVTFTLTSGYTGSCNTGTPVALGAGVDPLRTVDSSPLGAGSYAYRAEIAGNDNYLGDTSDCEPFTVDKAQLAITTAVHDSLHTNITNQSVKTGSVVHDTADVTGEVAGFAVPTVSFALTTGYIGTCESGSAVVNNGMEEELYKSADSAALGVGAYAYHASVAGDANYLGADSICEPFTVVNAKISITPGTDTNAVDSPHNFIVNVAKNIGSGWVNVEGAVVNVIVSPMPDGGLNIADCLDGTDASGNCTATINSSVAGIFTARARSTILVNGVEFKLETNGSGENSGPAVKTYVDAKILLTPLTATNNVNEPHAVTVSVFEDPGTGFVPAIGEHVDFTLTNSGGANYVLDTLTSTCDDPGANTGLTNQCLIVFNSATPGTITVHASSDINVGGLVLPRATNGTHGSTGDAVKTYVAGKIIVDKVTDPSGDLQSFEFDPDWTTNFNLTDAADPHNSGWIAVGTYSVSEIVPTGWDLTNTSCVSSLGGTENNTAINLTNGETVTCTFTNTKQGKITIIKDAVPNDCKDFTFNAPGSMGTFLLDDDAGLTECIVDPTNRPQSKTSDFLSANADYTITETVPAYWTLESPVSCTGGANVAQVTNGITISLNPGEHVTCTFVNMKPMPTRTQGFWKTHTQFTSYIFTNYLGGTMTLGVPAIHAVTIDTTAKLFGVWYSDINFETSTEKKKIKRLPVEKARILLAHQLVTAKLNCAAFGGCSSAVNTMIANADTAYAGTSISAMTAAMNLLDAFNNSGDTIIISPPLPWQGSATPKASADLADLIFWDTP